MAVRTHYLTTGYLTTLLCACSLCATTSAFALYGDVDSQQAAAKNEAVFRDVVGRQAASQTVTVQVGELYYSLSANSGQAGSETGTAVVVRPSANASYTFSSVSIPASISHEGAEYAVTEIGDNAFEGAKSLTAISIPQNILKIGERAFKGCIKLQEMRFEPASEPLEIVNLIFDNAAEVVAGLAPLQCYIGRTLNMSPAKNLFTNSGVVKCEIENVTHISDRYLSFAKTLKELVLHKGVVTIGSMRECHSLEAITVPEGVTTMANGCFDVCSSIKKASVPSTMQKMAGFYDSKNLAEVSFYGMVPPATYYENVYPFHSEGKGIIHVLPEAVEAYSASIWGKYPDKYVIKGDLSLTTPETTVSLTLQATGAGNIRITETDGEPFTGGETVGGDAEGQTQVSAQTKKIKALVSPDAGHEIAQCRVLDTNDNSLPLSARVAGQSLEIETAPAEGLRIKASFTPCATSTLRLQLPHTRERDAMHLRQAAGSPYSISYFATPGYRVADVWLDNEALSWQTEAVGMPQREAAPTSKVIINVPGFEGEKTLRIVEETTITGIKGVEASDLREMTLRPTKGGGAQLRGVTPRGPVYVTGTNGTTLYTGTAAADGTLLLPQTLKGILLISSPGHKTLRTRL